MINQANVSTAIKYAGFITAAFTAAGLVSKFTNSQLPSIASKVSSISPEIISKANALNSKYLPHLAGITAGLYLLRKATQSNFSESFNNIIADVKGLWPSAKSANNE